MINRNAALGVVLTVLISSCGGGSGGGSGDGNGGGNEDTLFQAGSIMAEPGDSQVTLDWKPVAGATSYNIYWNYDGLVKKTDNKISNVSRPYVHQNLINDTQYHYIITANTAGGETTPTKELVEVPSLYTIYYVSSSAANDSGDGLTPETAKRTIQAATDAAVAPALIKVNAGTYNVRSDVPTHVVLKDRIALYGGYSEDFSRRNPLVNVSVITDNASTPTGDSSAPARAVEAGDTVSDLTVLDGFTINGSTMTGIDYSAAIYSSGGATKGLVIQNCNLNGGSGSSASYGIYNYEASPFLTNIRSDGGSGANATGLYNRNYNAKNTLTIINSYVSGGTGSNSSTAIYNSSYYYSMSYPKIVENIIDGGGDRGNTYGVFNNKSEPEIYENLISGGNGVYSRGIYNADSFPEVRNNIINGGSGRLNSTAISSSFSNPYIDNNILLTTGSGDTYCIYEDAADPLSVKNNDLFQCATPYRDSAKTCTLDMTDTTKCSLDELNTFNFSSNNVSLDPMFANQSGEDGDILTLGDNDWHFSGQSPVSVTQGGINGSNQSWGFYDIDYDGNIRPSDAGQPWSMGAYEP